MIDAYSVKFWFQKPDTYWEQRTEIFFANGKNKHDQVEKLFKETYRNDTTKIISITYQ